MIYSIFGVRSRFIYAKAPKGSPYYPTAKARALYGLEVNIWSFHHLRSDLLLSLIIYS